MNALNRKFLEAGWIQVGEDIPVYFKHFVNTKNPGFDFFIIFPVDADAHFFCYERWLNQGIINEDKLPLVDILVKMFSHTYTSSEFIHLAIPCIISDYYFHNSGPKSEKTRQYEEITNHLENNYATIKSNDTDYSSL